MDGIEATRAILAAGGERRPRILILTTFDLDEHVYDALDAGASGFLLKDVTAERRFDAVRVVAAGEGCSRRRSPAVSSPSSRSCARAAPSCWRTSPA